MVQVIIAPSDLAKMLVELAKVKTPKFVSVKNYENNEGEVSDYVINLGVSYESLVKKDIAALAEMKLTGIKEQARIALLMALASNQGEFRSNQSKGQRDAYIEILPNVRLHKDSGRLFVRGFRISKTVLIEGNYKSVNSADLTIAKNKIRKELSTPKYRQFAMDKISQVRMNGETLEISIA